MDYRIDEKGKVFTPRMSKRTLPVTACIKNHIVQGTLHLKPDNRLKDEMNEAERFIALTNVQVMDAQGINVLYETGALIVNKDDVAWIFQRDSNSTNSSERP